MNTLEEKKPINSTTIKPPLIGIRHLIFILLFLAVTLCYGVRTVLSVAILAMTEANSTNPDVPTYPSWENTDTILSSFFWGYVLPQIGAGQLGEYFGPKWFLWATTINGAVFTILVPSIAGSVGPWGVMGCRMVQGISQGFLYPSVHNLLSKWTPSAERSMVGGFVYGGSALGIVTSMLVTGAICDSSWGWPGAFYLYGALLIVWALLWGVLGANCPEQHRFISYGEVEYIKKHCNCRQQIKKIPTPWKSIFTSLPMWAIFAAHCGSCWGMFTLLTEIPSYMKNIMDFDMKSNSKLSSLPYIALWIFTIIGPIFADKLIVKEYLTIGTTRKIFNSIGSFIPGAALIWLSFVDSSQRNLAVGLLIVAVGTTGGPYSGYLVNHIDLSPNHAGTLLGITNGCANVFSFVGPLSVGIIGSDKTDPALWTIVFCLAAGIYIGTGLFYLFFASGEIQEWNEPEGDNNIA